MIRGVISREKCRLSVATGLAINNEPEQILVNKKPVRGNLWSTPCFKRPLSANENANTFIGQLETRPTRWNIKSLAHV